MGKHSVCVFRLYCIVHTNNRIVTVVSMLAYITQAIDSLAFPLKPINFPHAHIHTRTYSILYFLMDFFVNTISLTQFSAFRRAYNTVRFVLCALWNVCLCKPYLWLWTFIIIKFTVRSTILCVGG